MQPDSKYLTFFLAGEEYGIEILQVQEIISMLPVTRVPRTPPFIRGVINLRGKVIPIVDLREKFGLAPPTEAEQVVIVVRVAGVQLGVIADSVSDVAAIADADIEPAPDFGDGFRTDFLRGLAKSNGRIRLLLDIGRVFSPDEVSALPTPSSTAGA